jgi:HEAT repeat protein
MFSQIIKRSSYVRHLLASLAVLALAVSSLVAASNQPVEPMCQGRTLHDWLHDLDITPARPVYGPAAKAVREMGTNTLPFLLQCIATGTHATNDWNLPNLAVNAMRELGETARPAIPRLTELMQREQAAPFAAAALVSLRSEAPVIEALTNSNHLIRRGALTALGRDSVDEEAVAPLILLLKDRDSDTRYLAAWALGRIHKRDDIAIPALTAALADDVAWVRKNALVAIGEFKQPQKTTVTTLLKALQDPDVFVRQSAISKLGEVCRFAQEQDVEVVSALVRMIESTNADVRLATVSALGTIMNGRLGGEHPYDRTSIKQLGAFEPQARILVPALIRAASDDNENVRAQAIYELGDIGKCDENLDAQVVGALNHALDDKSEKVRGRARAGVENYRRNVPGN